MKIRPVGAQLPPCERTDGRTDMTKLKVAFRNFTNAPKKDSNPHSHRHADESLRNHSWCLQLLNHMCRSWTHCVISVR